MNVIQEIRRINERELEQGVSGKASWHHEYKDSAWVFAGGFPYDLTEGDILCVMSQWGEIEDINLCREKDTGKSKVLAEISGRIVHLQGEKTAGNYCCESVHMVLYVADSRTTSAAPTRWLGTRSSVPNVSSSSSSCFRCCWLNYSSSEHLQYIFWSVSHRETAVAWTEPGQSRLHPPNAPQSKKC